MLVHPVGAGSGVLKAGLRHFVSSLHDAPVLAVVGGEADLEEYLPTLPKPTRPDLFGDVTRNFQLFDPLDFIAELTQHIPDPRKHLVRYLVLQMIPCPWPEKTAGNGCVPRASYSLVARSLRAFPMTDTELKLIAAAAIMGLRRSPKIGYRTPAAIGTPRAL